MFGMKSKTESAIASLKAENAELKALLSMVQDKLADLETNLTKTVSSMVETEVSMIDFCDILSHEIDESVSSAVEDFLNNASFSIR